MKKKNLLSVIKQAALLTGAVNVGFSGGKDSVVTLELCKQHFKTVRAYFCYTVPGMEFQERYLRFFEARHGVEFIRLPHWSLSDNIRFTRYRHLNTLAIETPKISLPDVEAYVASKTGIHWFATGQKKNDSLERRGMISSCGGVNIKTRRIYPVADWNDAEIYGYLKRAKIPLPPDYRIFGRSFDLDTGVAARVRQHFPEDYKKIIKYYPLIEAEVARYDFSTQPDPQAGTTDHR